MGNQTIKSIITFGEGNKSTKPKEIAYIKKDIQV